MDNAPEDVDDMIVAEEPRRPRHRRGIRADAFNREAEGFVPTDGVAWAVASHKLSTSRLLTFSDPRVANPPGFKGNLYDPQKTLLAAMIELECRPVLNIADTNCGQWSPLLQTKIGRISEKFSFGKTVLALALVCAQRVPARLPEQTPIITYALTGTAATSNRAMIMNYDSVGSGFLPECAVRYSRFLPLTIVAAAANVISQWEAETKRFTNLKYFIVEHVRSLREFETLFRNGGAGYLDLLFVKAGRVTTSFVVAGEPPRTGRSKNRSLFEALGRILEGIPVARLIIDDYDTLKLGSDDCFVAALFTWLISATRRQTASKAVLHTGHNTLSEFFHANMSTSFPVLGAALDDVLNRVFSLHCAPSYVDEHISSCAIGFRRIFVRGGQAAAILRDLDVPEEIVEMVNADAVGTAAQSLGIAATSVGDVIRRVVGAQLDKLRYAIRAIVRVDDARTTLQAKPGREHNRDVIKELRAALKEGSDAEVEVALSNVAGLSPEVSAALKSLDAWAAEQRDKHGKTLNRMRANIREGHCQCCQIPFEADDDDDAEAAYILAGCCQIIVCEPCITHTERGRRAFIKRCPNCARDITLTTGLVRVGAEIDLDAALKDEHLALATVDEPVADDAEPAPAAEPIEVQLAALNNPKLKALVQFIRGDKLDCIRNDETEPYVTGLLAGRHDRPWPADKRRKLLVFTMHAESTALIGATLSQFGIGFSHLRGTRQQKDECFRSFLEDVDVLLVTAAKDCGGRHLPYMSHVVFYNRVVDRNVEAQVAARGQRTGREYNFEVVTLVNEAEAEDLR